MKLKFSDKFNCRKNSYHSSQIKFGPVLTIHRRQKSGLVNSHLYHYAGSNPMVYVDPTGEFDKRLFFVSTLKAICGGAELLTGLTATGISGGLSFYLIVDGFVNMYDGFMGMTNAIFDEEYTCVLPLAISNSLESLGVDEKTAKIVGDTVSVVKGAADIFITSGASLSSSYANTIPYLKTVDTVISASNVILELESAESTIYNNFIKLEDRGAY